MTSLYYILEENQRCTRKKARKGHSQQKKLLKQITYIKGYEAAQGGCREESQTRFGEQKDRLFG